MPSINQSIIVYLVCYTIDATVIIETKKDFQSGENKKNCDDYIKRMDNYRPERRIPEGKPASHRPREGKTANNI